MSELKNYYCEHWNKYAKGKYFCSLPYYGPALDEDYCNLDKDGECKYFEARHHKK